MKKSDQTRQMIIRKAAALFNQKGFAGTSMQDIMDATQMSKGGIYGNFKKGGKTKEGVKQEIALAAFEHSVDYITNEIGRRTRIIDNCLDKLKAVLYFYKERMFDMPIEGGCPILNTSIEADDNHPALKKHVVEALDIWHSRVVHTINKGIKNKEIKPDTDAEAFATLFIGMIEGGIMMARIKNEVNYFNVMAKQLLKIIEDLRI
ncbi:MAG: TetR/AcrR family transcriptional regulator [Bacteroidota bacterium]